MRWAEGTTILTGLVGSQAYGLAHGNSDNDYLSVHVAPIEDILGLKNWAVQDKSIVTTDPDHTSHEIGKFCRLAIKGNPTVNELMWLSSYHYCDKNGQALVCYRKHFLSRHTYLAYRGYIKGQIHKLTLQDGTPTPRFPKASKHVMRLVFQLIHLVTEGNIQVALELQAIETVQEMMHGKDFSPEGIELWANREMAKMDDYTFHPLLSRPEPDTEVISDMLVDIRKQME